VLYAAAYVSGEFADLVEDPEAVAHSLLLPSTLVLPGHIQSVFVQNSMKIYAHVATKVPQEDEAGQAKLLAMRTSMLEQLVPFMESADLEVQERAVCANALLKYVTKQQGKGVNIDGEVAQLFEGELNPVAAKAQRKVPVPEGLDLDKWINPPPKEEVMDVSADLFNWMDTVSVDESLFKVESDDEDTKETKREQRKVDNAANPYHLGAKSIGSKKSSLVELDSIDGGSEATSPIDVDSIPVKKLDLGIGSIFVDGLKKKKKKKLTKKEIKKLKKKGLPIPVDSEDEAPLVVEVAGVEEMPEGAAVSDGDDGDDRDEIYKALDINLDEPMTDKDVIARQTHHIASSMTAEEAKKLAKQKIKDAKKAKKEEKAAKKAAKKGKVEGEADAGADEAASPVPAAEEEAAAPAAATEPAKKEKKEKKAKKDKKDKKDKKEKKSKKGALASSAPRTLASNSALAVTVETVASAASETAVEVTFAFENLSAAEISGLKLTIPASDATGEVSTDVPCKLAANGKDTFKFSLEVKSIGASVVAPGSITYGEETLAFELPLLDSTLVYAKVCSPDDFASLLGGGDLTAKEAAKVPSGGAAFGDCLAKLCSSLHLHVVESMDGAASLYGLDTKGAHLCFLVKASGEEIALSAKSSNAAVLSAIIAEAKVIFA
jgi:AP-3 complex subunit delta-1